MGYNVEHGSGDPLITIISFRNQSELLDGCFIKETLHPKNYSKVQIIKFSSIHF
ncbi:hypothetical protein PIROE2DRAFT_2985 [Piromyces sp. E2]|nr:hypothetical protein PIROE2DRAFT_2985 [Piromyces sp. E2]|eukprot:OUM69100.1 hypothetical protein PIROE2DRAFT_2985 [Piromyces sp. E2]